MKLALLLIAYLLMVSCATLDQATCEQGDWYQVGFNDGSQGMHSDRLEKHKKACDKHEIAIESTSYYQGYDDGTVQFCTPTLAFVRGRDNLGQHEVCPVQRFSFMVDAYSAGFELYQRKQALKEKIADERFELEGIESDIHELRRRNEFYSNRMDDSRARLADTDGRQREYLIDLRNDDYDTINRNRRRIRSLERRMRPYEAKIRRLREKIYAIDQLPIPLEVNHFGYQ